MKKVMAIVLAMVLVLAACGGQDTSEDVYDSASDSASDVTVGFIYVGPVGDGGWTYSHDQGRQELEEALGVTTIYKESVPEGPEVEAEIKNMIDQGASIIFATSFGYMDYVENMAKEFPDVTFYHCSGYKTAENMSNYFGRMYEARYLSGIVAGLKTESNKIGYVGAFAIPEVIRGINAFTLGAQSVNPDVEVEVVWTSTWYDPAKEKSAAIALLDNGADVIAQHQDTAGPQQAAEERGVYSIGYHTDMTDMAPKAHMTSAVWNWGDYYVSQVESVLDGSYESTAYWGGMEDGIVALSDLTDVAPEEAQAKVDEAMAAIQKGDLVVFSGELFDQDGNLVLEEGQTLTDEEMLSMEYFLQGVNGQLQ